MEPDEARTWQADEDGEFQRYYSRHLAPLERRFEDLRQKAVREHFRRIVAAAIAWMAAVAGIWYLASPIGELWVFVGFFGLVTGLGLGMWAWLPAAAHRLRLQDQILSRIVPFFGDVRYQSEPDLAPGEFENWRLLPFYSKTYKEDQIEGCYRGVPLKLAEIKLQYTTSSRSSGGSSTHVAFRGLMVCFELGREYPGVTLIRSRGSDMKGRLCLDEDLKEVGSGSGFEVFATHDAPGATLADASFLERLSRISAGFKARQFFASFHANHLVMLIDHKGNYFEMSHRQKTDFVEDAERAREQLGRFFAIIDLLQLLPVSDPKEAKPRDLENLRFPELPAPRAADPYDIGGWGCLGAFVVFAAAMAGCLGLLDPDLPKGALLWWSAFAGFLIAIGLFQVVRGTLRPSMGKVVFGFVLLSAACAVLYWNLPPDVRTRIRSWESEEEGEGR